MFKHVLFAALATSAFAACAVDEAPPAEHAAAVTVLPPDPPHCIAPWGIDWSDVLGVTDAEIVSPFCTSVSSAHRVIPEVLWITNAATGTEGNPVVYPDGYFPAQAAPIDDFIGKLTQVRYVIQPGGQQITYPASAIERRLVVRDLFAGSGEFADSELAWPTVALLGKLPALAPGNYRAEIHLVLSAQHCDGQTGSVADSCLPAGDTLAISRGFTVTR